MCQHYHRSFVDAEEGCRWHPGFYAGQEKGTLNPAVVYLWDCCDARDACATGFAVRSHAAYA